MSDSEVRWPRRGTRRTRALARQLLAFAGWRIEGSFPDEGRFVIIVAPHTSNWDFPVGVLAMLALGVRLSWLGKHTLFRFPLGPLMRWLGGEAIDRDTRQGTVEIAIDRFRTRPQWVMALTPEGTRKRVEHWKTGFLQIAVGAGVPIAPVSFDYRSRVVTLMPAFKPSGNGAVDLVAIRRLFRREMARYPEQFVE